MASEVQTEVVASVLGLEAEHRVKLSLLETELIYRQKVGIYMGGCGVKLPQRELRGSKL